MIDAAVASGLALALVAAALLAAATVAWRALTSFVLAAWLALLIDIEAVPLALSLVHAVGRRGYAALEIVVLALALVAWLRAGRPVPRPPDLGFVRRNPTVLVLSAGVGIAFAYELLLCLTVVPNNWDSLTYHLPRAAAWYQHGGVHWIPNAPTERQNAFPAGAELTDLWSFVAVRSDRLAAIPQLLAEAAAAVGIYGVGIRVGFPRPAAAFAALLFPTLGLVALESTTTQNDLVVASLVVAAAYFVLGSGRRDGAGNEASLAGIAVALAVGVKLTAALALPGLVILAFVARVPWRRALVSCLAFSVAFALLDAWLYIENVVHTHRLLGYGGGRVEHSPDLSLTGWLATVIRILYRFLDLTGVPWGGLGVLASLVTLAVLLAGVVAARRVGAAAGVVTALALVPLVTVVAAVVRFALTRSEFPIDPAGTSEGAFSWSVSSRAHEDFSYFGPLGLLLLVLVAASLRGRVVRALPSRSALAASFLLVVAGIAAFYRFNEFVGRFLLLGVGLAAPIGAELYRRRAVAAGTAALALVTLAVTLASNELKRARDAPWSLSRAEVLDLQAWQAGIGGGVESLDRAVPASACVGALLGGNDAAYPLFGAHLQRRITYVAPPGPGVPFAPAEPAVIIGPGAAGVSLGAQWRVESLGGYWRLAVRATAVSPFDCEPSGRSDLRHMGASDKDAR